MLFKTMKREEVLKALEGQANIIDRAVKENETFFKRITCPSCQGGVMPIVNPKQLYKEGAILPNYLGKCKSCGLEFEPHTGIIVARPET